MKHRPLLWSSVVLLPALVMLGACSSTPQPNAALDRAQAAYASASGDSTVQSAAPRELQDSHDFLTAAQDHAANPSFTTRIERIWSPNAGNAEIDHDSYMAQRYAEVAQERAKTREAALHATATARTMTLGGMHFATNKADLNANGMKAVEELAAHLKSYPNQSVTLTGYTDSTGSAALNDTLSKKRAAAVENALIQQGIDRSRLETHGAGASDPVASNDTSAGRQQNRRVEVAISQGGTAGVGSTTPPSAQ